MNSTPDNLHNLLAQLYDLLSKINPYWASYVRKLNNTENADELKNSLMSNDIWGGTGSLSETSLFQECDPLSEDGLIYQYKFYDLMQKIGEELTKEKDFNSRIKLWVDDFKEIKKQIRIIKPE